MLTAWGKRFFDHSVPNSSTFYSARPFTNTYSWNGTPCAIEGKDYQGNTKYFTPYTSGGSNISFINSAINSATYGIAVGSGDTAATENDYTLESPFTSGITGSISPAGTCALRYNSDTDSYSYYIDITVTNMGSESITIREIGKYGNHYYSDTKGTNAASNSAKTAVLFDRTVLENPVTIAAGEAAVIRYEFVIPNTVA